MNSYLNTIEQFKESIVPTVISKNGMLVMVALGKDCATYLREITEIMWRQECVPERIFVETYDTQVLACYVNGTFEELSNKLSDLLQALSLIPSSTGVSPGALNRDHLSV